MGKNVSRRDFIRAGGLTLLGAAGAATLAQATHQANAAPPPQEGHQHTTEMEHGMPMTVGEVDHERNGFNPSDILTDFDYGQVSELENGQPLREYTLVSVDKIFELVPGIEFSGW